MQIPPQKKYIKKHLILRPRKDGSVKLEVGDEIPRRWKEAWKTQDKGVEFVYTKPSPGPGIRSNNGSNSPPVKNKEYFDKLDTDEYDVLDVNANANIVPILST